jgi:SAM-dependent methyltransferase
MNRIQRLMKWLISPPSGSTRSADTAPDGIAARKTTGPEDDFMWMCPPRTVTDAAAWDQYWKDQIKHGAAGLVHMFCRDGQLVDAMLGNGLRTILCVGNGVSQEPRALAAAGFAVTVLDLSPFAMAAGAGATPPEEALRGLLDGWELKPGGSLDWVAGDLRDTSLCPGPYDVIIERLTLQLFSEKERPSALEAVARRLSPKGIFFSHTHDGSWRPPKPRWHATQKWFTEQGWQEWTAQAPLIGRVVWTLTSTG